MARAGQQMRSTAVKGECSMVLSLETKEVRKPKPEEVVVRIEAAPINPSDLGMMLGPADKATLHRPEGAGTLLAAKFPEQAMGFLAARLDKPLPMGNEGAGIVVEAGSSAEAQALLGKTVGVIGGGMYSQYRVLPAAQCICFPEGVTPSQAASWHVNPMTVLAFIETMRREGYTALVHTAAASNLGQILVKVCLKDGINLVNIVRKPEQVTLLKSLGATHVVDSSSTTFMKDLTAAIAETGAYLAFDAINGGRTAGHILQCMERASAMGQKNFSMYAPSMKKQVYIYGGLDWRPTTFKLGNGGLWNIGGWLLPEQMREYEKHKERVSAEITTTFASSYAGEISLVEALDPEVAKTYAKQATGEKYLINPNKGLTAKL